MLKKIAELKVFRGKDPYDKLIEAIQSCGYEVITDTNGTLENYYIIAESDHNNVKNYNSPKYTDDDGK